MGLSTYLDIPDAQNHLLKPDRMLYPFATKKSLSVLGRIKVKLKSTRTGEMVKTTFHVMENDTANLLSCATSLDLKLVSFVDAVTSPTTETVVNSYKDRFEGI